MIDVLRIAHLRIAPQEGNLEVGNCEGNHHDDDVDRVTYDHVRLGQQPKTLSGSAAWQ